MISIITICRNHASEIKATLESVLNQDIPGLEYIVIDGQSTDGSLEILQSYSDQLSILISEPDAGIYDAINKGLSHATQPLVGILHVGDTYEPGALKAVTTYYHENPCAMLMGNFFWKFPEERFYVEASPNTIERTDALCHQAIFYERQLHEEFGSYDLRFPLAADYAFIRQVYEKHGIAKLEYSVCAYALGGVSDLRFLEYAKEVRSIETQLYGASWNTQKYYYLKTLKHSLRQLLNRSPLKPLLLRWKRNKHTKSSSK